MANYGWKKKKSIWIRHLLNEFLWLPRRKWEFINNFSFVVYIIRRPSSFSKPGADRKRQKIKWPLLIVGPSNRIHKTVIVNFPYQLNKWADPLYHLLTLVVATILVGAQTHTKKRETFPKKKKRRKYPFELRSYCVMSVVFKLVNTDYVRVYTVKKKKIFVFRQ